MERQKGNRQIGRQTDRKTDRQRRRERERETREKQRLHNAENVLDIVFNILREGGEKLKRQ